MVTENTFIDRAIETINSVEDIYVGDISNDLNFRKSLFDMVNAVNPQDYTLFNADFINLVKMPAGSVRNTKITLIEIANKNTFSAKYIWYNRIHTNLLGTITLPKNNAIKVSDLIDGINVRLGSSILKSELTDFTLPIADNTGFVSFQLLFNNTSFRYYNDDQNVSNNTPPVQVVTKQTLGLGRVDNTSDLEKPLSLADLQSKAEIIATLQQHLLDHPGGGTPAPTPSPTQGTGPGPTIKTFRNVSNEPMPRGTPIFSPNSGEADKAVGTFSKHRVIGLNTNTEPLLQGVNGNFVVDGSLICTGPEWQEITDMPGGLLLGRKYFLDTVFPGKLRLNIGTTNILPGSYLVCVGYAVTATELKLEIQPPVRLA